MLPPATAGSLNTFTQIARTQAVRETLSQTTRSGVFLSHRSRDIKRSPRQQVSYLGGYFSQADVPLIKCRDHLISHPAPARL